LLQRVPAPAWFLGIPISNREYDTYRQTVKVPKGLCDGETQGRETRETDESGTKSGGSAGKA